MSISENLESTNFLIGCLRTCILLLLAPFPGDRSVHCGQVIALFLDVLFVGFNGGGPMAKRQGSRILVKMKSTESSHYYHTEKNRQNTPDRLELKKFDPFLRKHVPYREDR